MKEITKLYQWTLSKIKEKMGHEEEEYCTVFKLTSGGEISVLLSKDKFQEVENWFTGKEEGNYLIKTNDGYINLNKINIIGFSYSKITAKERMLNPYLYVLTSPAPHTISLLSFFKALFLVPAALILYIIYERCIYDSSIKNILARTSALNGVIGAAINMITVVFMMLYVIFFIAKLMKASGEEKCYLTVKSQLKSKVWNYAVFNFFMIIISRYALLAIKYF